MRTMKKSKMICAAVLTGVLGAAALAGCAQEMADTGATYNPGEPPLMTASHEGRYESLGAAGCFGCHGGSDEVEVFLAAATPLPGRPLRGRDASTHEIDGPRAECITCHPGGPGVGHGRREGGHSSLVVEARPESVDAVARALAAMEGVEVHEVNGYKIVVTIEASSTGASHEISSRFIQIPGVLNVNLVYVNFEDETLG